MKIGHPNHPRRNVLTEIEWAAHNGFDFVDLFLEPDAAAIENVDPTSIRDALAKHNLEALGHLAWYLPIGSAMPQIRRAAASIAIEHLRVFAEVGVPAVSIHSDWPSGLFSAEEGIAYQVESLTTVVGAARDMGLGLMFEPIPTESDSPENIRTILNAVPGLICHIDTGHSNLCGRRPEQVLRYFADVVRHIHISDNNGRADLHLPPGTGNIDWDAVFTVLKEIGYDRTLTLEVFSEDKDYVLLARQKIAKLCG